MAYSQANNSEVEQEFPKILRLSSHRNRGGGYIIGEKQGRRETRERKGGRLKGSREEEGDEAWEKPTEVSLRRGSMFRANLHRSLVAWLSQSVLG